MKPVFLYLRWWFMEKLNYDERLPMSGHEPEMFAQLELTLTTMPQPLAWGGGGIYWRNNLYGLRSEIIYSPPVANNWNPLLLIKLPWIEWSLRIIQYVIFTLTRAYKCKLRTNKLLEASGIKLNSVLENVYDKPKLQTRGGSKWAAATAVSESQFRQCRNSALPHPLLSFWTRRNFSPLSKVRLEHETFPERTPIWYPHLQYT